MACPGIHMGDPKQDPGFGMALAFTSIWGLNQKVEDLSLSHPVTLPIKEDA